MDYESIESKSFCIIFSEFREIKFQSRANQVFEDKNIKHISSYTSGVNVNVKDPYSKFKLPRLDPVVDQSWCSQKFDLIELAAHLLKLSVDLVTNDTAEIWSDMANRDVTIKEKLVGVFRTQNEMLALRREYENKRRKSSLRGVSTPTVRDETKCFSLILSRVPLPNLIFAITVDSDMKIPIVECGKVCWTPGANAPF